jgi:hypothetical protein
MPRIIVTTDHEHSSQDNVPVLLDEHVLSEHLSDDYGAMQIVERLGWAVRDAEEFELARGLRPAPSGARRSFQPGGA